MTPFDYVVLGILLASMVLGAWRGVIGEIIALAAWVLAFFAAKWWGDEFAKQLLAGIADGTLRRNIGSPTLVAMTLWGFMHGIIQIMTTKGEVLEFNGVKRKQLVDQALALCTQALKKE